MIEFKTGSAAAALAFVLAGPAAAATLGSSVVAYSLGNEGRSLVKVADPSGGPATAVTLSFASGASQSLDTLTYRPKTGQLYGYDDEHDTVYQIDIASGVATAIVTNPNATTGNDVGFDFNNVIDAARIVSTEDENVVFFPNNMPPTLEPKTPLAFVPGDPNFGKNPNVDMNAYTNAVPDAKTTQQFVIDSDWNILATLGNNAGTLATVGELFLGGSALDITEFGGFDILSKFDGDNTAYALLTTGGTQAIYQVPLFADAAGQVNLTWIADVTTDFGNLDGFTVFTASQVPLPASAGLIAGGFAALGLMRRLRRPAKA